MKKITYALMLMVMMLAAVSQAQTMDVRATWEAPTEGSPAVRYWLQISEDGGNTYQTISQTITDTTYILSLEVGTEYIARVAAYDTDDRVGPWSLPSDPYTPDLGPPSAPGKPVITEP